MLYSMRVNDVPHKSPIIIVVGLCFLVTFQLKRVRLQGDLTDPSYFDFITFAQLATISQEIPIGQQAFEVSSQGQAQMFSRSGPLSRAAPCQEQKILLKRFWRLTKALHCGI